jgi:hypothetical protein
VQNDTGRVDDGAQSWGGFPLQTGGDSLAKRVETNGLAGSEVAAQRIELVPGGIGDGAVGVARTSRDQRRQIEHLGDGRQFAEGIRTHPESLSVAGPGVEHFRDFVGPVAAIEHVLLQNGVAVRDPNLPPVLGQGIDDEPENRAAEREGDEQNGNQVLGDGFFDRHGCAPQQGVNQKIPLGSLYSLSSELFDSLVWIFHKALLILLS